MINNSCTRHISPHLVTQISNRMKFGHVSSSAPFLRIKTSVCTIFKRLLYKIDIKAAFLQFEKGTQDLYAFIEVNLSTACFTCFKSCDLVFGECQRQVANALC